ncbi:MAG: 2,3-bisphosphoglycerate-independent phosphoglycerate mutase, partial [Angelakisella sp.]
MKKPIALIILDGFGYREEAYGNAVKAAKTPNIDKIFAENPCVTIGASGMDVGLPDGQMGNSEVGHTNIGAGRVVYQELTRITKSIKDGDFFTNPALVGAVDNCLAKGTALHICGLLSDGGVHSHNSHIYGLLELAKKKGLEKVFVHCFMDGRDVPPSSGRDFVADLLAKMQELGVGKIATISGRYYAMDRDNRWERVSQAYDAMVNGKGSFNADPVGVMKQSYKDGKTDEFVLPTVCTKGAEISADDSVIFANFRPDRAREITRTMVDPAFDGFPRPKGLFPLYYVCMTQYDVTMPNVQVAFKPQSLENTFGAYISEKGLSQLRIAETEKYAHVTFFFNGGEEVPNPLEDRILVPSPKVATYDLQPEMSAYQVTDKLLEALNKDIYDVIYIDVPPTISTY